MAHSGVTETLAHLEKALAAVRHPAAAYRQHAAAEAPASEVHAAEARSEVHAAEAHSVEAVLTEEVALTVEAALTVTAPSVATDNTIDKTTAQSSSILTSALVIR